MAGAERLLAGLDTIALRFEALVRRARRLGITQLGTLKPLDRRIVYLDLGLHKQAVQIALVLDWFADWPNFAVYGFEAHPDYVELCRSRFANDSRVQLFNLALVGPGHEGETATLHVSEGSGKGSSLFAARGRRTITVPAKRLSGFLKENGIVSAGDVVLLRMNIEGAETYVIDDLVDAGMAGLIDGYYGMWDDLFKIDPELDDGFRQRLRRAHVHSFPFNDRDSSGLAGPRRRNIIRYDLITSIYAGAKRKVAPHGEPGK
ncbi:MAG TPA: FkbM family methyltransferase [Rhizomicrobium sp.]